MAVMLILHRPAQGEEREFAQRARLDSVSLELVKKLVTSNCPNH
jgi:hypothetical protein